MTAELNCALERIAGRPELRLLIGRLCADPRLMQKMLDDPEMVKGTHRNIDADSLASLNVVMRHLTSLNPVERARLRLLTAGADKLIK